VPATAAARGHLRVCTTPGRLAIDDRPHGWNPGRTPTRTAFKPADDAARLETLHSLSIPDTPPEKRFDRLARCLFGVPIARVSVVDENRQWFNSHPGSMPRRLRATYRAARMRCSCTIRW
jgi:hypothetical protein